MINVSASDYNDVEMYKIDMALDNVVNDMISYMKDKMGVEYGSTEYFEIREYVLDSFNPVREEIGKEEENIARLKQLAVIIANRFH